MTFYFDKKSSQLLHSLQGSPIERLGPITAVKRMLRLGFKEGYGLAVLPRTDQEIWAGVTTADGTLIALADAWIFDKETRLYSAFIDFNTSEAQDAFGDEEEIEARFQVIWRAGDQGPYGSQVMQITLRKTSLTFGMGTPVELPSPSAWIAAYFAGLAEKAEVVDADQFLIADSAASGATKWSTLTSLWSYIVGKINLNFLRVDEPQGFDAEQKSQGLANLGAAAQSHSHSLATSTTSGFLSSTQFQKLSGLLHDGSYTFSVGLYDPAEGTPMVTASDYELTFAGLNVVNLDTNGRNAWKSALDYVSAVAGKGLSENDYLDADQEKVSALRYFVGSLGTSDTVAASGLYPSGAIAQAQPALRVSGDFDVFSMIWSNPDAGTYSMSMTQEWVQTWKDTIGVTAAEEMISERVSEGVVLAGDPSALLYFRLEDYEPFPWQSAADSFMEMPLVEVDTNQFTSMQIEIATHIIIYSTGTAWRIEFREFGEEPVIGWQSTDHPASPADATFEAVEATGDINVVLASARYAFGPSRVIQSSTITDSLWITNKGGDGGVLRVPVLNADGYWTVAGSILRRVDQAQWSTDVPLRDEVVVIGDTGCTCVGTWNGIAEDESAKTILELAWTGKVSVDVTDAWISENEESPGNKAIYVDLIFPGASEIEFNILEDTAVNFYFDNTATEPNTRSRKISIISLVALTQSVTVNFPYSYTQISGNTAYQIGVNDPNFVLASTRGLIAFDVFIGPLASGETDVHEAYVHVIGETGTWLGAA